MRQRFGFEWPFAAGALVEDHAERVDVRPRVDVRLAPYLLGRHVERRSDGRAFLGDAERPRELAVELRDAEIEDLHERLAVALDDEEVLGFEISVDDAPLV